MSAVPPEFKRLSRSETQLKQAVGQYARLMRKADTGRLRGDELDQLVLTGLSMRQEARELGITNKQLDAMLDNMVRHLNRAAARREMSS